jgi:methylglyoxal reductase
MSFAKGKEGVMQKRALGISRIEASVVGLGTWAIGGWMWGGTDDRASIAAIQAAIEEGITLIDTAPAYGFGHSEELVGRALAGRRDRVVLATKCGLVWHCHKGNLFFNSEDGNITQGKGKYQVYRYLGRDAIRYELEQSLRRLKVDCIDLYQTHWQDATTPIAETMDELLRLKQAGKIRAIGVSNATPAEMDQYRAVGPLDADQENFSMLDRNPEADILPHVRKAGMAFLAYSPLAQGLLTGAIGPDRVFDADDLRSSRPRFNVENRRRVARLLEAFRPVAEKHRITLGQLAIAWAFHQPGCTHVLIGARNPKQAEENARAGTVVLDATDLAAMSRSLAGWEGLEE